MKRTGRKTQKNTQRPLHQGVLLLALLLAFALGCAFRLIQLHRDRAPLQGAGAALGTLSRQSSASKGAPRPKDSTPLVEEGSSPSVSPVRQTDASPPAGIPPRRATDTQQKPNHSPATKADLSRYRTKARNSASDPLAPQKTPSLEDAKRSLKTEPEQDLFLQSIKEMVDAVDAQALKISKEALKGVATPDSATVRPKEHGGVKLHINIPAHTLKLP